MAFDLTPISVKDSTGNPKPVIAYNNGTNNAFANALLDALGALINPATADNQATANTKLDSIIANTDKKSVTIQVSPTVAGTTHVADDVVGGKISLANAVRVSGGSGLIQTVTINVRDNVSAVYDVLFFKADPAASTFTDDAALSVAAADQLLHIGTAQCTTVVSLGTNPKSIQASNVAMPFKLSSGTTLYAVVAVRGSAAYTTANGVSLSVGIIQD